MQSAGWRLDSVAAFYLNGALRNLYMALTSVFVPLFVYKMGTLTGGMREGLLYVVLYFVLQRLVVLVLLFPISKLIERVGFRRSISLSVLFLSGYTAALMLSPQADYWVWISAICGGIQIPLYWIARDSALSQDISGEEMGSKMGYNATFEGLSGLLAPFVGGVIVVWWGYTSLFVVALAILGISAVPLWWMGPHTHHNGVSLTGFWYFLTNGRNSHQVVANWGAALNDYGGGVIWPLLLFLAGITVSQVGMVYSLVALVAILVQYVGGRWFDRLRGRGGYSDELVYAGASVGVSLTWIVRIFTHTLTQVVPVDMVRQIFGALHGNFFGAYIHLGGRRMGSIAYWVYMEVVYSLAAIFIFGVMAVGIYLGNWREMILIVIAFSSLTTVVMARESNL